MSTENSLTKEKINKYWSPKSIFCSSEQQKRIWSTIKMVGSLKFMQHIPARQISLVIIVEQQNLDRSI